MKSRKYGVLFILALIGLHFGCSGNSANDDKIVLKVGDYKISIGQLNWQYIGTTFKGPEDEFRQKSSYLQKLYAAQIAADIGIQMGLDKMISIDSATQAQILLNVARQKMIKSKLNYTDSDLREYWTTYGARLQLSQIVLDNQAQADYVYDLAIKNPDKFDDLIAQYTIDGSVNRTGGLFDSLPSGVMLWQFDEVAFKMKPGEISKPVKTRAGWHIIKLLGRKEPDLTQFAALKPDIEDSYIKQVFSKTIEQYNEYLKKKEGFEVVESTVKMMKDKLDSLQNVDRQKGDSIRPFLRLNDLPEDQAKMILVKIKSQNFTAYDYLGNYKSRGIPSNVDFFDKDVIINVAYYWRHGVASLSEAIRNRVDQSPEYKDQLEERRRMMINSKLVEIAGDTITISDQEARQFYEENKHTEFSDPEKVRVSEILVASEPEARGILDQLAKGTPFNQLVGKTIRPGTAAEKGDLGYLVMGDSGVIYDEAVKLVVGQYGGPVKSHAGYSVIMVTDRKPRQELPFEKFEADIKAYLKNSKLKDIMNNLVEEHKKKIDNFLDLELLKTNLVTGKLQNAN
jgi:parvulin-like peptidyl-prolyl isomerase